MEGKSKGKSKLKETIKMLFGRGEGSLNHENFKKFGDVIRKPRKSKKKNKS